MTVAYFILSQCIYMFFVLESQQTPSKCFPEESLSKGLFAEMWVKVQVSPRD